MGLIHSEQKGNGHPLILIHGFCENGQIWNQFAQALSDTFTIFLPDLPGCGKSPPPSSFTLDTVAGDLLTWLDELNLKDPVVIGHSLGGYVTLAMVQQQPDRFPGFGLFHSTAYADSAEKKENRNRVIDFVTHHGVQPFIETLVPGLFHQKNNPHVPDVFQIASQTRAETLVGYAAAMRDRPDRLSLLESYTKPILLIAGEEDSTIPYAQASTQAEVMRFPFFCGLKDTGHMGMFESELKSIKIVRDFMKLALGE